MRLAYKILLVSLLPLVGTTIVLIVINSTLTTDVVQKHVDRAVSSELDHYTQSIRDFFNQHIRFLKLIATSVETDPSNQARMISFLKEQENLVSPYIERLYFDYLDGSVVSSAGTRINVTDRYYFPQISSGDVVVTRTIISRDTGRPVVLILVPVRGANQDIIGAIGGTILVEALVEAALQRPVGEEGFAALIDESGTVVAPRFPLSASLYDLADDSKSVPPVTKSFAPLVQEIRKKPAGATQLRLMNEQYLAHFQPIPMTTWNLALLFPEKELVEGSDRIQRASIYIVLIAAAFVFLMVYGLSRSVLKPVRRLMGGHRALSEGKYGVHVPVNSRDEFGDLSFSFNSMSDRLQRIQAERQRAFEDQLLLAAIIENTTDLVALIDRDFHFQYLNAAGRRMLRLEYKSSIERYRLDNFLTPESFTVFQERLKLLRKEEDVQVWHQDLEYTCVNHKQVIPVSQVTIRYQLGGEPEVYFSVIARDISEARQAEKELIEAKTKAEAADRAKTAFLATISHELRTPIQGVLGSVELIQEEEVPEDLRFYISIIERSGRSLLDTVNDILEISGFVKGRVELTNEPFVMKDVVQSSLSSVQTLAENKGLKLVTDLDARLLEETYVGDSARTRQVLVNLLGNAVKFTKRGEVRFRARKLAIRDNKTWVRFEIEDTGPGIPEEARPNIFQEFYQVDSSLSRSYGGVGLGLAICKRFVDLMGGRIGFYPAPEQGTTFWVEVPFYHYKGHRAASSYVTA